MRIGLTGGIGSGKTTVAKLIQVLGYPVYNSDDRARYLTENSLEILKSIREYFGDIVFDSNHKLIRQELANIVFNDAVKLQKLNSIIHPIVAHDFDHWCRSQKTRIVFKEAAIIFEHGIEKHLDEVWVVSAPKEIRIQRVIDRSSLSEHEICERMSKQLAPELLIKKATRIITNDNTELLIPQVIHALELAQKHHEITK